MKNIQKNKYNIISKIIKYGLVFSLVFILISSVMAADSVNTGGVEGPGTPNIGPGTPNTGPGTPNIGPGTPNTSTGVNINTGIKNPIAGVEDIPSFIEAILSFVLIVGVPLVTLAIIYSGFLFVTAQGNSEKLTQAKKALLYTLIGATLLLGSYVIAHAIKGTVDDIKSTT